MRASREVIDKVNARRDAAWRRAGEANRRRVLLVLFSPLVPGIVLVVAGLVVFPLLVIGAIVVAGWAAVATLTWRSATTGSCLRVRASSPPAAAAAGAVTSLEAARFEDVTESLCAALGLAVPRLEVLETRSLNAISAGGGRLRGQGRIVLTSGLLAAMERIELEAVLAHELAHLKRLDTLSAGVSVALLHGGRAFLPGGRRLARWLEGNDREVDADLAAVGVTRYPPALIAVIEKIEAAASAVPTGVGARVLSETASQWLYPLPSTPAPGSPALDRRGAGTEPGFGPAERLEVLHEF